MRAHPTPHRVAVLALDGVVALDLTIATHVFGIDATLGYRVTVCGETAGPVRTSSGFGVVATAGLGALRTADTVVVPGVPVETTPSDPVLAALRAASRRGARVMSICTGAFALAAAGLLDGRRATTHWMHTDELARRFPAVTVDPAVLYVDEGDVLTSAGVAAGIDLCLHLLRRDHGAAAAAAVARRMVVAPHRDGGQAQFIDAPVAEAVDTSLARTREWAMRRLDEPLTVRRLARHAALSERTLARRWVAETGVPPLQWVTTQRVLRARQLLETTERTLDDVARRAGLGTADNLRLHFTRTVGTTPSSYRRQFARG